MSKTLPKNKEWHICMGCGKDTTARGGVCRQCYSNKNDEYDGVQPLESFGRVMNPIDEYELEVDELEGFEAQ